MLDRNEVKALQFLVGTNQRVGVNNAEMAAHLDMTQTGASGITKRLREAGLSRKDRQHARAHACFSITQKGMDTLMELSNKRLL